MPIITAARAALPKMTLTMAAAALIATGGALLAMPTQAASSGVALRSSVTPLASSSAQTSYEEGDGWSHGYRCEWREGWRDDNGRWHDRSYGWWDGDHRWHDGCDDR